MAEAAVAGGRRRRLWKWAPWGIAAGLIVLPLLALFVMAATDHGDNIPLSRNEVVQSPSGERAWRGTFWNNTDSLYTDLDAVILFLDAEGKPVGQARGGAARLNPGQVFHLQAKLPPQAARMQMYQLRWTTGWRNVSKVLGPYRPWEFGYVQASE